MCTNTVEMRLRIDPTSREPIYRQLVEQVERLVAGGDLNEGDKLPSVRELAVDLRINPNTVARAYGELETEGVVIRQRGRGVYIAPRNAELNERQQQDLLRGPIDELLLTAWKAGVDLETVLEALTLRAEELLVPEE